MQVYSVTALMIDFIVLCLCCNRAVDCLQCFWPDGQPAACIKFLYDVDWSGVR